MPKVLIADDSIAVRKVAERHLIEAGFQVVLAANAKEAIALSARERPDLIICDVIMPDKSGFDVCSFVRSNPSLSHTPILLISGIVNDEVTNLAKSCRADAVLKKPFQGTSLKDRALELLGKRPVSPPSPAVSLPRSAMGPAHTQELTASLAKEQARTDDGTQLLADRVKELESILAREREEHAQVVKKLEKAEDSAGRVTELESVLAKERDLGAKWRVQELQSLLGQAREHTTQLKKRLAEVEPAEGLVKELEALLTKECEQTSLLTQRLAVAEQIAAQANAKQEEMVRKLARIANLCQ